jgi:hypothetical protein
MKHVNTFEKDGKKLNLLMNISSSGIADSHLSVGDMIKFSQGFLLIFCIGLDI